MVIFIVTIQITKVSFLFTRAIVSAASYNSTQDIGNVLHLLPLI